MTTTNTGILTMSGVRLLIRDIARFEHISTNIVARPIDMPLTADVVVANVGHMPRSNTNVGFSLTIPFINILKQFIYRSV